MPSKKKLAAPAAHKAALPHIPKELLVAADRKLSH